MKSPRKSKKKSRKSPDSGRRSGADKANEVMSGSGDPKSKSRKSPGPDLANFANEAIGMMSGSGDAINAITLFYREYMGAQSQRMSMDTRLGAYLRHNLGWRKDLPEKQRKAIEKEAAAIAKDPEGTRFAVMVRAEKAGCSCFDAMEADALKEMVKLAVALPVWQSWGKDIRGFGAKSLAVIVAEAGDLSNYPDKSKLWKRMGLAVFDGRKQGRVAEGLSKEDRKAAFIEHGYNPKRRSQAWNIGETMIKAQVRKVKDDADDDTGERISLGEYGQCYLDRKAYELARNPEMAPLHAHRCAQRYMEKRLLKHLWQAWRRANRTMAEKPKRLLPAADITPPQPGMQM